MGKDKRDADNRNELFAGKSNIPKEAVEPQPVEPVTAGHLEELVDEVEQVHKETTATTKRALRVIKQTEEISAATLTALKEQGETLGKLPDKLEEVNEHVDFSTQILNYMARCFCCQFCDSCTGADPDDRRAKQIRKYKSEVDRQQTLGGAAYKVASASKRVLEVHKEAANGNCDDSHSRGANGASTSKPTYRDPHINLGPQFRHREQALKDQTAEQNELLDQIDQGLDNILAGARAMKEELKGQAEAIDEVDAHAEDTGMRLRKVNVNPQLRNLTIEDEKPAMKMAPSWKHFIA